MQVEFNKAAKKLNRENPTFKLSILMIPHWDKGNNYDSANYQLNKKNYLKMIRDTCSALNLNIAIESFDDIATTDEKLFLSNCKAKGNCADIMKNRSIIDNIPNRHLNIDTNTIINDFDSFYKATMGATEEKQQDGFNASYYGQNYACIHNKVVYTQPFSNFANALKEHQSQYIKKNKNNQRHKQPAMYTLYSIVFSDAAIQCGLINKERRYSEKENKLLTYSNPINFSKNEYSISEYVVTAVHKSWAQQSKKVKDSELKKITPIIPYKGDKIKIDFSAIQYIIKKNTDILLKEREKILKISDNKFDKKAMQLFFNCVVEKNSIKLIAQFLSHIPPHQLGRNLSDIMYQGLTKQNKDALSNLITNYIKKPAWNILPYDLEVLANSIPDKTTILLNNQKQQLNNCSKQLLKKNKNIFFNSNDFKALNTIVTKKIKENASNKKIETQILLFMKEKTNDLAFMTPNAFSNSLKRNLEKQLDNIIFKYAYDAKEKMSLLSSDRQNMLYNCLYDNQQSFLEDLNDQLIKQQLHDDSIVKKAIASLNKIAKKKPHELNKEEKSSISAIVSSLEKTSNFLKIQKNETKNIQSIFISILKQEMPTNKELIDEIQGSSSNSFFFKHKKSDFSSLPDDNEKEVNKNKENHGNNIPKK